ncbi:MAG: phage holin family protein [Steroidobacterales bacterium]
MTDDPGRSARPGINSFLDSLGQLIVTAVEMVHTRLELVFTEFQEAVEGLVGLVLWWLIALLAAGMGLLFGGLALIFVFWDTHRVLVAALIMCAFLLLAAIASWVALARIRQQRSVFTTTLTELAKDRELIRPPP